MSSLCSTDYISCTYTSHLDPLVFWLNLEQWPSRTNRIADEWTESNEQDSVKNKKAFVQELLLESSAFCTCIFHSDVSRHSLQKKSNYGNLISARANNTAAEFIDFRPIERITAPKWKKKKKLKVQYECSRQWQIMLAFDWQHKNRANTMAERDVDPNSSS